MDSVGVQQFVTRVQLNKYLVGISKPSSGWVWFFLQTNRDHINSGPSKIKTSYGWDEEKRSVEAAMLDKYTEMKYGNGLAKRNEGELGRDRA